MAIIHIRTLGYGASGPTLYADFDVITDPDPLHAHVSVILAVFVKLTPGSVEDLAPIAGYRAQGGSITTVPYTLRATGAWDFDSAGLVRYRIYIFDRLVEDARPHYEPDNVPYRSYYFFQTTNPGSGYEFVYSMADEWAPQFPDIDGASATGSNTGNYETGDYPLVRPVQGMNLGEAPDLLLTVFGAIVDIIAADIQPQGGSNADPDIVLLPAGGSGIFGMYEVMDNVGPVDGGGLFSRGFYLPAANGPYEVPQISFSIAYKHGTTLQSGMVGVAKATALIQSLETTFVGVAVATAGMQSMQTTIVGVAKATALLEISNVPIVGANGIFNRIGHFAGLLNLINTHLGTPVPNHVETISRDYGPGNDEDLIEGIYDALAAYQQSANSMKSSLQTFAQSVLVGVMTETNALPDNSVETSLRALVAQMTQDSLTVQQNTVTLFGDPQANQSDAVLILSDKNAAGVQLQNVFTEHMDLVCTADVLTGAQLGQETLTLTSEQATRALAHTWPAGTGIKVKISALAPGGAKNLLSNPDFEEFDDVTGLFTDWTFSAGVGDKSTDQVYTGSAALRIACDGATKPIVYQTLDAAGGRQLKPLVQYALNFWIQSHLLHTKGVLRVSLAGPRAEAVPPATDPPADAPAAVNDAAGTANALSVTLGTGSYNDVWIPVSVTFRTPLTVSGTTPSADLRLVLEFTEAGDAGGEVWIDGLTLAEMQEIYPGGPSIAMRSGANRLLVGDAWRIQVSNAGGVTTFQRVFDRFFSMRDLGLQLPATAGSPSVPDSLIV